MNDYISKPIDERVLYNRIISFMNQTADLHEALNTAFQKDETKLAKCINLDYLYRRTKSNPTLIIEMIEAYLDQTPSLIMAMKDNYKVKNWKLLYATVHKMIPSFSIVGIHSDFEIMAKKIQDYAMGQQETESIHTWVTQLEIVCLQACKELRNELVMFKKDKNE
jgi:HPt (histidine-containing phosphotransfer) domain-containing protein